MLASLDRSWLVPPRFEHAKADCFLSGIGSRAEATPPEVSHDEQTYPCLGELGSNSFVESPPGRGLPKNRLPHATGFCLRIEPTVVPGAVLESGDGRPSRGGKVSFRRVRLYSLRCRGEHPSEQEQAAPSNPPELYLAKPHDFMVPEFIWKPKSPEEAIRLWSAGEGLQRENDVTLRVRKGSDRWTSARWKFRPVD